MSNDSVDRTMDDLERRNRALGSPYSPEFMSKLRQKLEGEAQQKAELAAQKQAEASAKPAYPPPVLRRDINLQSDKAAESIAQRDTTGAEDRLRRISADTSTSNVTVELEGLQPTAIGEKASADRAETSPEKKDKEIYLAEKRLNRL